MNAKNMEIKKKFIIQKFEREVSQRCIECYKDEKFAVYSLYNLNALKKEYFLSCVTKGEKGSILF
jgi:hypothetical protein